MKLITKTKHNYFIACIYSLGNIYSTGYFLNIGVPGIMNTPNWLMNLFGLKMSQRLQSRVGWLQVDYFSQTDFNHFMYQCKLGT